MFIVKRMRQTENYEMVPQQQQPENTKVCLQSILLVKKIIRICLIMLPVYHYFHHCAQLSVPPKILQTTLSIH